MNVEMAHKFISLVCRDHLSRFFHVSEHLGKQTVIIAVNAVIIVFQDSRRTDVRGHKYKYDPDGDIQRSVLYIRFYIFQIGIRDDGANYKTKSDRDRNGERIRGLFQRNGQTHTFRTENKKQKDKFVPFEKTCPDKDDTARDQQRKKRFSFEQRRGENTVICHEHCRERAEKPCGQNTQNILSWSQFQRISRFDHVFSE